MLRWVVLAWIAGLVSAVPYAAYYLFYQAQRDEYALLIVFILFWIFGYWGVVGPLLAALKVRAVFRAIENAKSKGQLLEALQSGETEESLITLIASENRIPRFLARKVYRLLVNRFAVKSAPT
jgi:hypothetical protein